MNVTTYLKHVQLFHSHQPNFIISCNVGGCRRSYKTYSSLRNHIYEQHSQVSLPEVESNPDPSSDGTSLSDHDDDFTPHSDSHCVQQHSTVKQLAAQLLLGLKEEKKLTQVALQGCIEGVTSLTQIRLAALHEEVCKILQSNGVSQSVISNLSHLFDENGEFGRPFVGLETQHQQMQYFSTHCGLIVSQHFLYQ